MNIYLNFLTLEAEYRKRIIQNMCIYAYRKRLTNSTKAAYTDLCIYLYILETKLLVILNIYANLPYSHMCAM